MISTVHQTFLVLSDWRQFIGSVVFMWKQEVNEIFFGWLENFVRNSFLQNIGVDGKLVSNLV
jgi:hypothetical protein